MARLTCCCAVATAASATWRRRATCACDRPPGRRSRRRPGSRRRRAGARRGDRVVVPRRRVAPLRGQPRARSAPAGSPTGPSPAPRVAPGHLCEAGHGLAGRSDVLGRRLEFRRQPPRGVSSRWPVARPPPPAGRTGHRLLRPAQRDHALRWPGAHDRGPRAASPAAASRALPASATLPSIDAVADGAYEPRRRIDTWSAAVHLARSASIAAVRRRAAPGRTPRGRGGRRSAAPGRRAAAAPWCSAR